jgi:carbon-monoxide dehydrogenase small subunit
MKKLIALTVNGIRHELAVMPNKTLSQLLRQDLNPLGTKEGCGIGDCGACTVIMNGRAVNSCLVLAAQADGCDITTIEGISEGEKLNPIQQAFVEHGSVQCGFCTPGMILSAKNLLDRNPDPSEEEVRVALAGNLCRCTGYQKIVEAVLAASKAMKAQSPS